MVWMVTPLPVARDQSLDRHGGHARRLLAALQRHDIVGLFLRLGLQLRIDSDHDFAAGERPVTDQHQQIFEMCHLEDLEDAFKALFGEVVTFLLEGASQDGAAEIGILQALLGAHETADTGLGATGDDEAVPGRVGGLRLGGDDLDLVAIIERRAKRHHPPVDLGADAMIAHRGMDGIGEIDRTGTARQRDQVALRREAEHLVLEHLHLGMFQELLGV